MFRSLAWFEVLLQDLASKLERTLIYGRMCNKINCNFQKIKPLVYSQHFGEICNERWGLSPRHSVLGNSVRLDRPGNRTRADSDVLNYFTKRPVKIYKQYYSNLQQCVIYCACNNLSFCCYVPCQALSQSNQ